MLVFRYCYSNRSRALLFVIGYVRGFFRVKYQPGVETDRLGPKGYRGGCGGKCMGLAWEKYDCGRIFDRLKLIIETEAAYNYPLSIG